MLYYPPIKFNSFSDRDLLMRFRGGGVGHKSTREATDSFRSDRDRLDTQLVTATQVEEDNEEGYASGVDNIEDEEEDYGYNQDATDGDEPEDENGDDDFEMFGYADL